MARRKIEWTADEGAVAERIAAAREAADITQRDLAESIGVRSQQISTYERGLQMPRAAILQRIAEVTRCDPGWLLSGQGAAPVDATGAQAAALAAFQRDSEAHGIELTPAEINWLRRLPPIPGGATPARFGALLMALRMHAK